MLGRHLFRRERPCNGLRVRHHEIGAVRMRPLRPASSSLNSKAKQKPPFKMRNSGVGVRPKKASFPVSENEETLSLRSQAALSPLALFSLWAPRRSVSGTELEERTRSQLDGRF